MKGKSANDYLNKRKVFIHLFTYIYTYIFIRRNIFIILRRRIIFIIFIRRKILIYVIIYIITKQNIHIENIKKNIKRKHKYVHHAYTYFILLNIYILYIIAQFISSDSLVGCK